jgi:hypothetical protein
MATYMVDAVALLRYLVDELRKCEEKASRFSAGMSPT